MLQIEFIIGLLQTEGIGRKTVKILIDDPGNPCSSAELLQMLKAAQEKKPRIRIPSEKQLQIGLDEAQDILESTEKYDVKIMSFDDKRFPERLEHIPDPPLVLYVKGYVDCLDEDAVAIVGTRNPTEFGKEHAEKLGRDFAKENFVVVSGLALGCDSSAHEGCLSVSGSAVAVLAHGLDEVYPDVNQRLAEKILETNGCLVSEYPVGTSPRQNNFIERNRLQIGLSLGLVVVETNVQGGTMHTVGFCREQRKPLACLNHPEGMGDLPQTRGNRNLIEKYECLPIDSSYLDEFIDALKERQLDFFDIVGA